MMHILLTVNMARFFKLWIVVLLNIRFYQVISAHLIVFSICQENEYNYDLPADFTRKHPNDIAQTELLTWFPSLYWSSSFDIQLFQSLILHHHLLDIFLKYFVNAYFKQFDFFVP